MLIADGAVVRTVPLAMTLHRHVPPRTRPGAGPDAALELALATALASAATITAACLDDPLTGQHRGRSHPDYAGHRPATAGR